MPNAYIPLSFRPTELNVETPAQVRGRMLTLAHLAQRNRAAEQAYEIGEQERRLNEQRLSAATAAFEQEQERLNRARRVREILGGAADLKTALPEIYRVDPEAGMAVERFLGERENEARRAQQAKLDLESKREGYLQNALAAISGEPDETKFGAQWKVRRAQLLGTGLFKPEELPETLARADALARISPEVRERVEEVIPLPESLSGLAGRPGGARVSLSTLGRLGTAQAALENAQSLAEVRKNPKPASTQVIADDEGNLTAVQVMPDGTVRATPVRDAKGRTVRTGGPRGAVDQRYLQGRIDRLQREHDQLHAEEAKLHARRVEIGKLLEGGVTGKNTKETAQKVNALKAELDKHAERIKILQQEKAKLLARKEELEGQTAGGRLGPASDPLSLFTELRGRLGPASDPLSLFTELR